MPKEHKQNFPKLQTLKQDTVSFSGIFSKKPKGPEYVTKEAYDVITEYIEKNADNELKRKAVWFIKQLKRCCEEGLTVPVDENIVSAARRVEKENIEELGKVLMMVKENVVPSPDKKIIEKSMDEYKRLLGTRSN